MTTARNPDGMLRRFARRTGGVLRGVVAAPAAVPTSLVAALAFWPVLLFAFFVLPQVRYLNVPPLFSARTQSLAGAKQAATPSERSLAVLVRPLEGVPLTDDSQSTRTEQLRQRVGTNILVASGYLSGAYLVANANGNPPLPYYVLKPDGRVSGCAGPTWGDTDDPKARAARLALAIVAVEKFNRNAAHRFVENSYAALHRWAFGRLPDLSFGPAQVRLSLLRRLSSASPEWAQTDSPEVIKSVSSSVAQWSALSDDQLLAKLLEECGALRIVSTIALHHWARSPNDSETMVAAAYAGQRRRSKAPIDYGGIVSAMAWMMAGKLPSEMEPPKSDDPKPEPEQSDKTK